MLLPVDNTVPNASPGEYALIMPVPNGIVHLFADCPHPYTALLRIRRLKTMVPTIAPSVEIIEHWCRAACHKGTRETSALAQTWEAPMFENDVWNWAQNKHDQLLPRILPPPSAPPQPAAIYAAETEAIVQRALDKKKAADMDSKGCRKMRPREYNTYLALAGLPEETT